MSQPQQPQPKLGTFLGVFTPTVLTILGVIMYLKTGWVVSNAGLIGALLIVVFANAITFLSALSMSALATNMRVGVGGAYFLISRSLGLEVGGAIGIPLYLSQALSVTLYAYGLSLSMLAIAGVTNSVAVQVFAGIIVLSVGALASRSASLALKMQLPIMGLIFASLIAFFAGVEWGGSTVPMLGPWGDGGFFQIFAVFFPAVTGILAGVSMSGDLEDPGQSIPRGVLAAVAVGFVVYMAVPVALANAGVDRLHDELVWTRIAVGGPLFVVGGMWGAILSSALGSVLAAPRTLQALAMDRLAPTVLEQVDEETGEPLYAIVVTTVIALLAVGLGALESVAAVLTMFFLTTYGTLNLVAGLEDLVGDPSFRPRIRIPWWLSFIGAAGCFLAMMAIHPLAATVAIAVEIGIYTWLRRRSMQAAWGDVRGGMWMSVARYSLLALRDARVEPRNWRPHILMFTADLSRTLVLAKFASDFSQQRGIVTISTLMIGDVEDHGQIEDLLSRNKKLLEVKGILAFPEVAAVPSFEAGVITVAQANGFAGLSSNTVLLGWPGDGNKAGLEALLRLTRKLSGLEKCTIIARLHDSGQLATPEKRTALVWWKGREHNGDLMLLLAHLLSLSEHWRGMRIVLKSVVEDEQTRRARAREFAAMLPEIRMDDVSVDVIRREDDQAVGDIIREHSQEASLVFMGMSSVAKGDEGAYAQGILDLLEDLPSTVLVRNAGAFRGRLV